MTPIITPLGDQAVVVVFSESLDLEANRKVHALDAAIAADPPPYFVEAVPAFASLMVRFDPLHSRRSEVMADLSSRLNQKAKISTPANTWTVPVAYGGEYGPDLDAVAAATGRTASEVVSAHADGSSLRVLMLGFAPGFAYLGLHDESWDVSRRGVIHAQVPAGSILVAARQTAIAATATPTGWHVIGRTPIETFSAIQSPPALFSPGDEIAFESIDAETFVQVTKECAAGTFDRGALRS